MVGGVHEVNVARRLRLPGLEHHDVVAVGAQAVVHHAPSLKERGDPSIAKSSCMKDRITGSKDPDQCLVNRIYRVGTQDLTSETGEEVSNIQAVSCYTLGCS